MVSYQCGYWLLFGIYALWIRQGICEAQKTQYSWGSVISGDYCDYESFRATCPPGEIIAMGKATYGHMAMGRCVEFDTGQLGCQSDVHDILHEKCSGKQTCEMSAADEVLRATSTCRKGVTLYLDASYACVKVIPTSQLCQTITASKRISYIASTQAESSPCTKASGVYDQEFTVKTKPGQKIIFTLINLQNLFDGQTGEYRPSQELGYILDSESDTIDPIKHSERIESTIAQSKTHQASIFVSSNPGTLFLVGFQVTGCPDLRLSSDVIIDRDGDTTTVSCPKSKQTWQLHCRGNQWIGVIGNCSVVNPVMAKVEQHREEKWTLHLPKDIIIMIIACATLFVAVVVVTAGYVCLKWPKEGRKQAERATLKRPEIKHMRLHSTGGSDIVYLTPRYSPEGEGDPMSNSDYQPIWEMPLPRPPNNEQTTNPRPAAKRNNEDTYNLSLSSNSTDYERKKYFVLDKDYIMSANNPTIKA